MFLLWPCSGAGSPGQRFRNDSAATQEQFGGDLGAGQQLKAWLERSQSRPVQGMFRLLERTFRRQTVFGNLRSNWRRSKQPCPLRSPPSHHRRRGSDAAHNRIPSPGTIRSLIILTDLLPTSYQPGIGDSCSKEDILAASSTTLHAMVLLRWRRNHRRRVSDRFP